MANSETMILSLETSGSTCGIALMKGSRLTAEYSVYGSNLHDKLMANYIKRMLTDLGITLEDLDAVAVSSGPGSFTGLRIGGSIAKALTLGDNPRLIAVPTLTAIACTASEFAQVLNADRIIAAAPSHKDLLYYQEFDSYAHPAGEIIFGDTNSFAALDKAGTVFCGPGAGSIKNGFTLTGLNRITPRFIGSYALKLFDEGRFVPSDEFVPLYVQEFQPKTRGK